MIKARSNNKRFTICCKLLFNSIITSVQQRRMRTIR